MKTQTMPAQQTPQKQTQTRRNGPETDRSKLIQQRAYERYLQRGQVPGYELDDWLHAEREVSSGKGNRQTA